MTLDDRHALEDVRAGVSPCFLENLSFEFSNHETEQLVMKSAIPGSLEIRVLAVNGDILLFPGDAEPDESDAFVRNGYVFSVPWAVERICALGRSGAFVFRSRGPLGVFKGRQYFEPKSCADAVSFEARTDIEILSSWRPWV